MPAFLSWDALTIVTVAMLILLGVAVARFIWRAM
jgi:hypothetical protein